MHNGITAKGIDSINLLSHNIGISSYKSGQHSSETQLCLARKTNKNNWPENN